MLTHSTFGQSTLVEGLETISRYKGPEFLIGRGRRASLSTQSHTRSFSPPSVAHICWGELRVLFINRPCLVLIGFSSNWTALLPAAICKIENLQKSFSETQMLSQILKVTFVKATSLWLSNFPSLQNNSSSTRVHGWALLGNFSLPWHLWHFASEFRVSRDFLNFRPLMMDAE